MAGLRINLDADLTRFTQLVKQIQKVRAELGKLFVYALQKSQKIFWEQIPNPDKKRR